MRNVLHKIVYEFSFENIFSTLHCLSNEMIKQDKKKSFPIHDPLYKLSILNEIQ
jgi:hypothetical protein